MGVGPVPVQGTHDPAVGSMSTCERPSWRILSSAGRLSWRSMSRRGSVNDSPQI